MALLQEVGDRMGGKVVEGSMGTRSQWSEERPS